MGKGRRKMCKIIIGSHLYGLDTVTSDRDYAGVFLPSSDDILGLEPYPIELVENEKLSEGPRNQAGDIDCKYFSLRQFMKLAAQGQSAQLEMLYVQDIHYAETPSEEWLKLVAEREIFLSQQTFVPFVRFALAQANKATMKGENLRFIRELISWIRSLPSSDLHRTIRDHVKNNQLGPIRVEISTNDFGAELLSLAHRKYDTGASLKRLYDSLLILESKYGTRSRSAADSGIDHKSLSHAYRMIFEAEEMLSTGRISLPLAEPSRSFVRAIKEKRIPADLHWERDILERINRLEHDLAPQSGLPKEANWTRIKSLHEELLRTQL